MVHNGIEYGDMQMICEAYDLMKRGLGLTNAEMHEVFTEWNKGELDSYLIEITRDILGYKDDEGKEVVDLILDTAGQKGTGKWTVVAALDDGMPLTLIGEAVFARCLSAVKDERVAASQAAHGPRPSTFKGDKAKFVNDLRAGALRLEDRLLRAGLPAHARRGEDYNWNLNNGGIALMWRGGCIIRCAFLGKIKEAFKRNPELANLLLDPFFNKAVVQAPSRVAPRHRAGRRSWASRCPASAARWPTTTATAATACRRTCSRPSATTSARTPTSAWTNRAASSSTPTGPAAAARPPRARTRCNNGWNGTEHTAG